MLTHFQKFKCEVCCKHLGMKLQTEVINGYRLVYNSQGVHYQDVEKFKRYHEDFGVSINETMNGMMEDKKMGITGDEFDAEYFDYFKSIVLKTT